MNSRFSKVVMGCALVVALATGLWLYVSYGNIKQDAIEKRKAETAAYLHKRAAALLKAEDFDAGDPALRQQSFQSFFDAVQSPDLVRMKIWNRDFTVVWSELRELIGQRFADNHEVREALEGKIEFEPAESKDEQVSERAFQALSETYVPFSNAKGEVVGVFEVYQPIAKLDQEIQSRFQSLAMSGIVSAALAFGILVLASWVLTKRERRVEGRA